MEADGINHELERPHVVVHRSRYYLFFERARSGAFGGTVAPLLQLALDGASSSFTAR